MTYTVTRDCIIDANHAWANLAAEWSWWVSPGYRATRVDPAEPPSVEDLSVTLRMDGKPVTCPDWLFDMIRPSDDWLLEHAHECNESAACDAADARREDRNAA